jgi:lipoate-protein ligase A
VSEELNLLFFPYQEFSAIDNMSIDHNFAQNFPEVKHPVFRLYGWKPYAVSLGYHQNKNEFNLEKLKNDGFDIIRRPTGGRAVFHGYELTYAAIFPKDRFSKFEFYEKIHTVFKHSFESVGIETSYERKNRTNASFYKSPESVSCFNSSAKYELMRKQAKLIGSAQRIYDHSILQHGSILLSKDYFKLFDYLNRSSSEIDKIKKIAEKKIAIIEINKSSEQFILFVEEIKKHLILEFSLDSLTENPFIHQRWSLPERDLMIN